jgi:hypothetical protein
MSINNNLSKLQMIEKEFPNMSKYFESGLLN